MYDCVSDLIDLVVFRFELMLWTVVSECRGSLEYVGGLVSPPNTDVSRCEVSFKPVGSAQGKTPTIRVPPKTRPERPRAF